jgi:hypothetical protein
MPACYEHDVGLMGSTLKGASYGALAMGDLREDCVDAAGFSCLDWPPSVVFLKVQNVVPKLFRHDIALNTFVNFNLSKRKSRVY